MKSPYLFNEFFASGQEESINPFLTLSSKRFAKNLSLKVAILSAFSLFISFITHFYNQDISSIFLLIVYVLSGTPALIQSLEDLRNLEVNIDVLMTLAALLSMMIGSGLEGGLLLVLFECSGAMEHLVEKKANHALVFLHSLTPDKVLTLSTNGHLVERSTKDVSIGTSIIVRPGEIVPLDGIVKEGSSFVNLSHLTGESIPISKNKGDTVCSGTKNIDGCLTIEVTCLSQDSTLTKIINLIFEASKEKPSLQRWIDRFGKIYASSIITLSFLFAISLPWFFSLNYLGPEGSIYRALAFLVAASPCALVIATPTSYLASMSSCAKRGILLKGGATLDLLSRCKAIAFDKTGTLTTGNLTVVSIEPMEPSSYDLDFILSLAASLEKHVKHPLADAILSLAQQKGIFLPRMEDVRFIPGSGIQGSYQSNRCFLGNADFTKAPQIDSKSSTQAYFRINDSLFIFHFQDELRQKAIDLIQDLTSNLNITPYMLTGDSLANARTIGSFLNIKHLFAHLSPEDKLSKVSQLSELQGLIMVGDGINDAPALARATVGISMGQIGSKAAVEASDVVLLQDSIDQVSWLIRKAKSTLSIVKQNVFIALFVILFATTPSLLAWIPLWLAVVLHEGGTLLVGLNSLRLLKK